MGKNKIFALINAAIGLLIILIPTSIFPVCALPEMHCRAVTLPALVVLGAVAIVIAGVQFFSQ